MTYADANNKIRQLHLAYRNGFILQRSYLVDKGSRFLTKSRIAGISGVAVKCYQRVSRNSGSFPCFKFLATPMRTQSHSEPESETHTTGSVVPVTVMSNTLT